MLPEVKRGIVQTLIGLLAPIYMLVLVWFIKWDKTPSYRTADGPTDWDPSFIIRGDLPQALQWAQTMDERFPGGMYEPTITKMYGNGSPLRALFTSYMWAGHRNRAHGLAFNWGKRAVGYIADPFDLSESNDRTGWVELDDGWHFSRTSDGVWRNYKSLGPFWVVTGYEVYRLRDGTFWAVNQFTLKGKK